MCHWARLLQCKKCEWAEFLLGQKFCWSATWHTGVNCVWHEPDREPSSDQPSRLMHVCMLAKTLTSNKWDKIGEQILELALWYKQSSSENWIKLQNTIRQQWLKNEYNPVNVCINLVQYGWATRSACAYERLVVFAYVIIPLTDFKPNLMRVSQ